MNARTILVLAAGACLSVPAQAQFSSDPANQLQVGSGAQNIISKVRRNPLGGYYVAWQGMQFSGGNTYVQRLDDQGNALWAAGGLQVTNAQNNGSFEDFGFDVDASGDVLVAFRDNHTGTVQAAIQKIAPDGTMPWGSNGVDLAGISGAADVPHAPGVVVTSDGSYVVKFTQGTTTNVATSRACFQRVDTNGVSLWNGGQPVVITPASNGYTATDMVASDAGNVIVTMFTTGSFTVSRRVHAQKLAAASGAQLWNAGSPVVVQTAGSMQIGNNPCVIPDGGNGVEMAWYTSSPLQCLVQHLDVNGAPQFPAGGSVASTNASRVRTNPWIAFDESVGQTYMVFIEQNSLQSQRGVYAQIFNAAGAAQLGDGLQILPVLDTIANGTPQNPRMALTSGGAIASWQFGTDSSGSVNMYVQAAKVTNEGFLGWTPGVTMVNSDNSTAKGRIDTLSSPGGGVIDVYGHGSGTWIIEASRINDDGTLGNPPPPCGSADFNCDGDIGTDADIEAFFACVGGNCPAPPCMSNADFNGDGDIGTDADIEAFFRVLSGGNC